MMKRNESGFTLVGVLAVFSILSVFGISLVMLSISSVKTSNNEHDDQSVFYIAEAGANYMANEIEQEAKEIYDNSAFSSKEELHTKLYDKVKDINKPSFTFVKTDRGEPTANITVEETLESSSSKYIITSTGTIGNQSRTVTQTVEVGWPSDEGDGGDGDGGSGGGLLPPFAVYNLGDKFNLQGKLSIKGDIGTASSKKDGIEINDDDINIEGNIYIPKGSSQVIDYSRDISQIIGEGEVKEYKDTYKTPPLPEFPDYKEKSNAVDLRRSDKDVLDIYESVEYKHVEFSNSTLNINTKGNDIIIIMKDLDLKDGSSINIIGNGTVTLYLHNKIDLQGESSINKEGNISQLNIYSRGKFEMDKSIINGSIYVQEGNIEIGDKSHFNGNIFLKEGNLDIQDNSNINSEIILAPNSKVELEKANIVGPVISNRFTMKAGTLDHKPPFTLTGPLSFNELNYVWPDKGQGTGGNGNEGGSSPKPDGGPSISIPPIKEIPNN